MAVFFVSIIEHSMLPGMMPLYTNIVLAMRATGRGIGTWIGAEPRVVRRVDGTALHGYETVVTWPIEIAKPAQNSEAFIASALEALDDAVHGNLQALGDTELVAENWGPTYTRSYSPSVNGPMEFWADGRASNTRTKNMARWGLSRITLPEENPFGPDDLAAQDPTPADTVRRVANDIRDGVRAVGDLAREQVTKNLWIALGFGAAGVALYLLVQAAPAIGTAASSAARRRNPVGRRPRKAPGDDWLEAFALEAAVEGEDWLVPAMLALPP